MRIARCRAENGTDLRHIRFLISNLFRPINSNDR
jgi:hypothetical protein